MPADIPLSLFGTLTPQTWDRLPGIPSGQTFIYRGHPDCVTGNHGGPGRGPALVLGVGQHVYPGAEGSLALWGTGVVFGWRRAAGLRAGGDHHRTAGVVDRRGAGGALGSGSSRSNILSADWVAAAPNVAEPIGL